MKFFLPLLFGLTLGVGAAPVTLVPGTDHYEFDLAADPSQGTLSGHVVLDVDPGQYPGGRLFLRLALNQETEKNPRVYGPLQDVGADPSPVGQVVSHLTVGGQPTEVRYAPDAPPLALAVNLEHTLVAVDLPPGPGPVKVAFDYQVRLHRNTAMDDFASGPRFFSRFSWFPEAVGTGDRDQAAARPFTYHARLTLPAGWDLAKAGTKFARPAPGQFEWSSESPVHSLPLAAVKDFGTIERTLEGGRTLTLYFEKDAESRARLLSTYAQDALEAYSRQYFPLDLGYISLVQDTPGFFGMAADGVVLLGNGLYRPADFLTPGLLDRLAEYVVAHELGHLYFGIGVGQDFLRDNYLSEGLNDSSTLLYLERKYGRWDNLFQPTKDWVQESLGSALADGLKESLRIRKAETVLAAHRSDGDDALNHASIRDVKLNAKASTDYDRPTFVFGMLAATLGLSPDGFAAILADTARTWYHRTLDTKAFQRSLEDRYQVSLDAFFQSYVTGPGWIDYDLGGRTNQAAGPGKWRQELEVRNLQPGAFVPTMVTFRYSDGTTEARPVAAAGSLVLETDRPIVWASLDFGLDALDYDRKNNFLPRQLLLAPDKKDRPLVNQHLDTVTPVDSFVLAEGGLVRMGVGPSVGDGAAYRVTVGPLVQYDPAKGTLAAGAGAAGWISPDAHVTWDLGVGALTSGVQSLSAGWAQSFSFPGDLGQSGRYEIPALTASVRAGGDFRNGTAEVARFSQAGAWNNLDSSGTQARLSQAVVYRPGGPTLGGRITGGWDQIFPSFPRTFLGAGVQSSWAWGALDDLGTRAEALGFSPGGAASYRADAGAQVFFGWPLAQGLGWGTGNAFVVQNLQAAVVYRWSAAFNRPGELATLPSQHALALALVPGLLTIGDSPIQGLALGVSLDLNAIGSHPESPRSWVPRLFVEASTFTAVLAQLSPW